MWQMNHLPHRSYLLYFAHCISFRFPLVTPPLRSDADKYLKVYTRHWAGELREVLLVEEVIDCAFEREVRPTERELLLQLDIIHKVWRQLACKRHIVARHRKSLAIMAPLV